MKLALLAALGASALLAGCSTTQTASFDSMVSTLHKADCHITVNIAAQAGVTNVGSGVQFQGSADCPGASPPAAGRVGVALGATEQPAPSASFLQH